METGVSVDKLFGADVHEVGLSNHSRQKKGAAVMNFMEGGVGRAGNGQSIPRPRQGLVNVLIRHGVGERFGNRHPLAFIAGSQVGLSLQLHDLSSIFE
jgi:hypothetical protein